MFLIFDGTGPLNDGDYAHAFAESFCRQLSLQTPNPKAYFRGPPGDDVSESLKTLFRHPRLVSDLLTSRPGEGIEVILQTVSLLRSFDMDVTKAISDGAFDSFFSEPPSGGSDLKSARALDNQTRKAVAEIKTHTMPNDKLFVAGHSRGGVAAILFAYRLLRDNPGKKIEAMFLFDAVNMTLQPWLARKIFGVDILAIPPNVRKCYHARRNSDFAKQYIDSIASKERELQALQPSLTDFRNMIPSLDPMSGHIGNSSSAEQAFSSASYKKLELEALKCALNYTRSVPNSWLFNWDNAGTEAVDKSATMLMCSDAFKGTHGALGGCPWPPAIVPEDTICTQQVRNFMWPLIQSNLQLRHTPGGFYKSTLKQ